MPAPTDAFHEAQAAPEAPDDPTLELHAADTITHVLQEDPTMAKEIKATLRTCVYVQELDRYARAAEKNARTQNNVNPTWPLSSIPASAAPCPSG